MGRATDKGFEEWYGPPRTYDEALWPGDPWYDPRRDPVSRMVEIRQGDHDVTERDQLTLDVRCAEPPQPVTSPGQDRPTLLLLRSRRGGHRLVAHLPVGLRTRWEVRADHGCLPRRRQRR
jgi:hypothetical protein